ncbi:MAG: leucine-rich repeat protein [Caryophanon sp.]|nr:leucine-rich repeat protein [Caryophanon sp.]
MKWWMASIGVAAIVCAVAPQVQAEEIVVVKDVEYELFTAANGKKEARVLGISEYNGSGSYVELVESVNGVPVTEVASQAFHYDYMDVQDMTGEMVSIQMKKLPASIVRIGDYAFWDVAFDGHITLGAHVESIGERAFEQARFNGLTIATAPQYIEERAFMYGMQSMYKQH